MLIHALKCVVFASISDIKKGGDMENAQIRNEDAKCIICQEVITNPICPECLAREIESWEPRVKSILLRPEIEVEQGVKCIFCGKWMNICAHCYSKDIYDSLAERDAGLAERFRELFNFGLRKEIG